MALYEYKCGDCGEVSEVLVYGDESDVTCKACGSGEVERILSTFAVSSSAHGSSAGPMPGCPSGGCCGGSCGLS